MYLEKAKPVKEFLGGNLIGIYGRGSSGKTTVSASFPNPFFIVFDDQGLNAIKQDYPDQPFIDASGFSSNELIQLLDEIKQIPVEKNMTFIFTTFSVWVANHSKLLMEEKKKAHMNQDLWGEHNTRVCQVISKCAEVAQNGKRIVLEFHERTNVIEGFENELIPEISVNAQPAIQRYLVGMLNYCFHTSIKKIMEDNNLSKSTTAYTIDISPLNSYYWIKAQAVVEDIPNYIITKKGTAYSELKKYFKEI